MKDNEILCTIYYRGSQGVKNKNLKLINNIPLIARIQFYKQKHQDFLKHC